MTSIPNTSLEEKKKREKNNQNRNKGLLVGRTDEAHGSAQEGVEAAASSVDAALRLGTRLQFGLHTVHQALPHHYLQTEGEKVGKR